MSLKPPTVSSFSLSMTAARFISRLVRFRTLPLAEFAFRLTRGFEFRDWLTVPYSGYRLPLELHRSVTHRLLCVEGERFVSESDLLRSVVRKDDVVIDVGANIGYLTLIFHQCIGQGGKIVCIEPDTDNLRELSRCIELNAIQNVTIQHAAVGASFGTVRLSPGLNGHVGERGSSEVPQITLDSLIHRSPTFIKVDVEGYESNVLAGARELIETLRPRLFFELHPALVPHRKEIRAILEKLDSVYPSVTLHEYRIGTGSIERLRLRYGLATATARIHDVSALLASVEDGSRDQPFWAVAQC
jgi:FkbM family methyltransferase